MLTAALVFYWGFSPAIINSGLSHFSEILSYPIILGILIFTTKAWQCLNTGDRRIIRYAFLLAPLFILIISVKGAFELILMLFLLPFFIRIFYALLKGDRHKVKFGILFIAIILFGVNLFTLPYKSLNQKYNGKFAFTDRGPWMFYASAVKRTQLLTQQQQRAFLASIPGSGVCRSLVTKEDCYFWSSEMDSGIGRSKTQEYERKQIPYSQEDTELIRESLKIILSHPVQYFLLLPLEGLKMFFWESTRIGFVEYPQWLHNLFVTDVIRYGIRLFLSALTLLAYFNLFRLCVVRRHFFFNRKKGGEEDRITILLFIFITVLVSVYSLVYVITRYSLPIASLYVASIALLIDNLLPPKKRS